MRLKTPIDSSAGMRHILEVTDSNLEDEPDLRLEDHSGSPMMEYAQAKLQNQRGYFVKKKNLPLEIELYYIPHRCSLVTWSALSTLE